MLALTEGPRDARVMLAHAHLGPILMEGLGQLRLRRLKTALVGAFSGRRLCAEDRLQLTRWRVETGVDVDRDELLDAARFAVANAEGLAADVLLDHLARNAPGPDVVQVRAELCFQRGQMGRAEQLFGSLDLTALDPRTAATAVRRQATILFHARGRYDEALDLLAAREADFEPGVRELITAHWIGLQAFYGRAVDVIARAETLPADLDLAPRLETLRSLGQARLLRGEIEQAIELLELHSRLAAELPAGIAQPGFETSMAAMITCHMSLGAIDRSGELIRQHLPVGRRTMLAWLPIAAARCELAAGRPRMARELIQTPLAAVRSQNLLHAEPLMTGLHAQAQAHVGEMEGARRDAEAAAAALESLDGQLRLAVAAQVSDVWLEFGELERSAELAIAAAGRAREIGNVVSEAELLGLAAAAGTAGAVVDRLAELTELIDGWLWPLRLRHVRALAAAQSGAPDDDELGAVELEFRRLGYGRLADLARRARG
jgi:tetratricopeptide (TPR) repeat protein